MKKLWLMVIVAFALAACGDVMPAINSTEPFHIAKVEAWGPVPAESSEEQLEDLRIRTAGSLPMCQ